MRSTSSCRCTRPPGRCRRSGAGTPGGSGVSTPTHPPISNCRQPRCTSATARASPWPRSSRLPPARGATASPTCRGKPHVGGQGVYTRHLTKALVDLGHTVEVLGGHPFPILDERVPLVELPSLDIYNDHFPMRMPGIWELKHWPDFVEVSAFSAGTFPD